jgi:hypothetical protein
MHGRLPANATMRQSDAGSAGAVFTNEPQNARAARAASNTKPPLRVNDIAGLLARFDHDMPMPLQHQRLDVDSRCRQWATQMEEHGLLCEFEDDPQTQQWVIDSRPAVDHGFYSVDPRTIGTAGHPVALHCVYSRALQDSMVRSGFVACECTYHGRDVRLLPDPVPVTERMQYAQQEQEQAQEQEPVTIPDTSPSFSRSSSAKTAAEQLVQWMEDSVVVDTVKYSPMKLWSPEQRNFARGTHAQFWKHCQAYVYVRSLLVAPAEIKQSWTELRQAAPRAVADGILLVPEFVKQLKIVGDGRIAVDSWAWAARIAAED